MSWTKTLETGLSNVIRKLMTTDLMLKSGVPTQYNLWRYVGYGVASHKGDCESSILSTATKPAMKKSKDTCDRKFQVVHYGHFINRATTGKCVREYGHRGAHNHLTGTENAEAFLFVLFMFLIVLFVSQYVGVPVQ